MSRGFLHIFLMAKNYFYYVPFYYCIYVPPYPLFPVFSFFTEELLIFRLSRVFVAKCCTFIKIMIRTNMYSTYFSRSACGLNILLQGRQLINVIFIRYTWYRTKSSLKNAYTGCFFFQLLVVCFWITPSIFNLFLFWKKWKKAF